MTKIDSKIDYRNYLVGELTKEYLGPGSEEIDNVDQEYERISESPVKRYFTGILYPQKALVGEYDIDTTDPEIENESEEINPNEDFKEDIDEGKTSQKLSDVSTTEDYQDKTVIYANQYCPSSYGITFFISGKKRISINIKAAKYKKLVSDLTFVDLKQENNFIKKLPCGDAFEISNDKFFYKGRIDKDLREDIKEYCANIYLDTLPQEQSKKIIDLIINKKYRDLTSEEREGINRYYLIFSRIYDKAKNFKYRGYQRVPCKIFTTELELDEKTNVIEKDWDNEELKVIIKNRRTDSDGIKKITISVVNKNIIANSESKYSHPELSYFQNQLSISVDKGVTQFVELSKLNINYTAERTDQILYRSKKIFAAGHGCSVNWIDNDPINIQSEFLPRFEVPRIDPNPQQFNKLGLNVFSMKKLAYQELMNDNKIIEELNVLVNEYNDWLSKSEEKLNEDQIRLLSENKKMCENISSRISDGIRTLSYKSNQKVMKAFRLANLAMLIQRANTEKYFKGNTELPEMYNDMEIYRTLDDSLAIWRPFQLAFIILNINSIVNGASEDRKIVDLLWFPTGGGKTEAYLGVVAFTVFYRRLTSAKPEGTSVIMRYTLRLLTAQQFQRASSLICACEFIRKQSESELGKTPITIGLWVGKENTPNDNKTAVKFVNKLTDANFLDMFKSENPFQITNCPWCSTKLLNEEEPFFSGYRSHPKFHFSCINKNCFFHTSLPIQVVDELIYHNPTTLLFATVDKFARLAWDPQTQSIFGLKMVGNEVKRINDPPDLILQDELHLISGPLGSMYGLYESVIDYLCSSQNIFPKIICSTATIKKANEQIKSLFDREVQIFPSNYDKIEDNFFSEEIPISKERGRLYLGLMAVGQTQQSAQVKIFYSLLYHNLINSVPEELLDTYYSVVGYYNTINELGVATSLLNDDVKEKIKMLQDRRREIVSRPIWFRELTSRMRSKELPIVLNELENNSFDKQNTSNSIPVLLTTNMFSVGIDISRLNLMFMNGQPKSTSEYIQATSRIGRRDPGLAVILFDSFRPRDKSHYENFNAFHSSYYRFVEPTGVTPFSLQSRARALHTLLVIVSRLLYGLPENKDASKFTSNTLNEDFIRYLKNRISSIDDEEIEEAESEINQLIDQWSNKTKGLVYSIILHPNANQTVINQMNQYYPLIRDISTIRNNREKDAWPVMQSLRNVDIPTICKMKE